jgi:hypothetical protein
MNPELVKDASMLITYGLQPGVYGKLREYQALAARYRVNQDFRLAADAIAEGMGLRVAESTEHGVILAIMDSLSPFVPDVTSVHSRCVEVERRQLIGLCILGIAAVAFQRPGALNSDAACFVTRDEVYNKLVGMASELEQTETDGGVSESAKLIAKYKTLNTPSKTHKPTQDTLHWHLDQAFAYLALQRYVKKESETEGGQYGMLPRFRIQLERGGVSYAYRAVQEALKKKSQSSVEGSLS